MTGSSRLQDRSATWLGITRALVVVGLYTYVVYFQKVPVPTTSFESQSSAETQKHPGLQRSCIQVTADDC